MFLKDICARLLRRHWRDESGAVTVDWVVLTGLVVGMGLVVSNFIQDPVNNGAEHISNLITAD